jgi:hypothetical protein
MHCESTRIGRTEAKKEQQTKARVGNSSKKQTPDGLSEKVEANKS